MEVREVVRVEVARVAVATVEVERVAVARAKSARIHQDPSGRSFGRIPLQGRTSNSFAGLMGTVSNRRLHFLCSRRPSRPTRLCKHILGRMSCSQHRSPRRKMCPIIRRKMRRS